MMTNEEFAAEALRRGAVIKEKRRRRGLIIKTVLLAVVSLAVIVGAAYIVWRYGTAGTSLFAYLLTGILAYGCGGALTVFCLKRRTRAAPGTSRTDSGAGIGGSSAAVCDGDADLPANAELR